MKTRIPRRDLCHLVGKRAWPMTSNQRAYAWSILALRLQDLGEKDVPKFRDLIDAIRAATRKGKKAPAINERHLV